jgi:mRNA interferase RelE/StbE
VNWDYRIELDAIKDLRAIGPSAAQKVRHFLEKRIKGCGNPRDFGKPLRGGLHGLWHYRVDDYRLICRLQDSELIVLLVHVAHRSTVYD